MHDLLGSRGGLRSPPTREVEGRPLISSCGMATTQVLELVLCDSSFQNTVCVLCMLYACLSLHAVTTLWRFTRSKPMTPKFQMVLCLTTASFLRLACFLGFYSLYATAPSGSRPASPGAGTAPTSREQSFYAKSVVLLFNLPDFIVVSTYVLLVVVWFEGFLEARPGATTGRFNGTSPSLRSDPFCQDTHSPDETLKRDEHLGPNEMSF